MIENDVRLALKGMFERELAPGATATKGAELPSEGRAQILSRAQKNISQLDVFSGKGGEQIKFLLREGLLH